MKIGLISFRSRNFYPAQMCFNAFEDEWVKNHDAQLFTDLPHDLIFRLCRRVGHCPSILKSNQLPHLDLLIIMAMGPHECYVLEFFKEWRKRADCVVYYNMDSFPWQYDMFRFVKDLSIDMMYLSHKESVADLSERVPFDVAWLPYGVPESMLNSNADRDIWILSYGRVNENHAQAFQQAGDRLNRKVVQLKPNQQIATYESILEEQKELYGYLQRSQYILCYSVADTSPQRASGINPATYRYYEALAAGAFPLGSRPNKEEYDFLFPMDRPIITVPEKIDERFIASLVDEGSHSENLNILRAQNVNYMKEHHTWAHRVNTILDRIALHA